jgi:predicted membrane-bound spermidine synthase
MPPDVGMALAAVVRTLFILIDAILGCFLPHIWSGLALLDSYLAAASRVVVAATTSDSTLLELYARATEE